MSPSTYLTPVQLSSLRGRLADCKTCGGFGYIVNGKAPR